MNVAARSSTGGTRSAVRPDPAGVSAYVCRGDKEGEGEGALCNVNAPLNLSLLELAVAWPLAVRVSTFRPRATSGLLQRTVASLTRTQAEPERLTEFEPDLHKCGTCFVSSARACL